MRRLLRSGLGTDSRSIGGRYWITGISLGCRRWEIAHADAGEWLTGLASSSRPLVLRRWPRCGPRRIGSLRKAEVGRTGCVLATSRSWTCCTSRVRRRDSRLPTQSDGIRVVDSVICCRASTAVEATLPTCWPRDLSAGRVGGRCLEFGRGRVCIGTLCPRRSCGVNRRLGRTRR